MPTAHRSLSALVLAAAVIATPACAAQSGSYRYPQGPRVDNRAYEVGYQEGFNQGRDDARRGRPADYSRHGDYRSADDGYRGGNQDAYRRLFRDGFARGYNDAYRQFRDVRRNDRSATRYLDYGRFPYPTSRDARFRSPAAENGYRDGYAQGRDDGRDGDRYDPIRAKRYREGDHDYNNRYGSRDEYKREYRSAFTQGYEQGYRQERRF